MTDEPLDLSDDVRWVLSTAVQILEELPEKWRPLHNIRNIRDMLDSRSSGRDGLIYVEALATVLAFRTQALTSERLRPMPLATTTRAEMDLHLHRLNVRMDEFTRLFDLVQMQCSTRLRTEMLAHKYIEACQRIAQHDPAVK